MQRRKFLTTLASICLVPIVTKHTYSSMLTHGDPSKPIVIPNGSYYKHGLPKPELPENYVWGKMEGNTFYISYDNKNWIRV